METKTVKRITMKSIGVNAKGCPRDLPIARVYGRAHQVITGETQFGTWTGFGGIFEAVNLITGKAFKGYSCVLPDQQTSEGMAEQIKDGDGVTFAFNVHITDSDRSPTGYTWVLEPIKGTKDQGDPLAELRGGLPALQITATAGVVVDHDDEGKKKGRK